MKTILLAFFASSIFALDVESRPGLQVLEYDTVFMRDGSARLILVKEKMENGTLIVQVPYERETKVILFSEYKDFMQRQNAYQVVTRRCTWDLKHNDPDDLLLSIEWGKKWTGADPEKAANMAPILRSMAEKALETWPDNAGLKVKLGTYLMNDKDIK